ncbi:hypothetical protein [Defluviimonas salinarum]|uniref:hypothetical protein n=1 Tax=Defluviimonas salinarum TaxID=2992147 RepID=UPI00339002B8
MIHEPTIGVIAITAFIAMAFAVILMAVRREMSWLRESNRVSPFVLAAFTHRDSKVFWAPPVREGTSMPETAEDDRDRIKKVIMKELTRRSLVKVPFGDEREVTLKNPPVRLSPMGDKADDLTLIKGIGPKLSSMLNGMGFYHFEQIAAWTEAEVAWVDHNLDGFTGRASRGKWVAQAKKLLEKSAARRNDRTDAAQEGR